MATITFHELASVPWFRQRRLMKSVLMELFEKERVPLGSVDYIFCHDDYLLQINQQFLQHDDYTDIITFDLTGSFSPSDAYSSIRPVSMGSSSSERVSLESSSKGPVSMKSSSKDASSSERVSRQSPLANASSKERAPKLGEIYISIDRVQENAVSLGLLREEELRRVMFHGCLHLCGYKDKLNEQKVLMRKMEDKYLRLFKQRST